ncbi:MAG TPA: hypothetical protein VIR81_00820, partial [Myxococcales bacterium]
MLRLALTLLFAQSGFFGARFGTHGAVGRVMGGFADKVITLRITSDETDTSSDSSDAQDSDPEEDAEPDLEVVPPAPPVPPVPPVPPRLGGPAPFSSRDLPHFTEKANNVPTAELLHRIAQTAGWSMTLVGSPKDRIDIDVKDADPREALREVLKKSGSMGVLKNDKLVVIATPDAMGAAGTLIEKNPSRRERRRRGTATSDQRNGRDMVRVFQGDLSVPQGQIVQGDVVCVGGSVELLPGSVVQGDAVSVGGSVTVDQGALVMGQAVAVLGKVEVERGGQVMGEHVQVGVGKILSGRSSRHHSWLGGLGLFGFFPTIALFALTYL